MPCWISIRPTQCSLTGNTWKDFGAFWLVYLKKCWKFNTGSGDTKTISVLVMFPTSTFLKRRELRQIRRICGKWKSDKCDTSWEHLDLSKKRPFAATRPWRIFIHMSLQNVHKGLFYPHSEGTIGQLSGLSNQFLSFDRLCEYTRRTFQFNGATASEIDWAKWTTQRFYSPGRFQHFEKRGEILLCLTREIFTEIGRNLLEPNYRGGQGLKIFDYLREPVKN